MPDKKKRKWLTAAKDYGFFYVLGGCALLFYSAKGYPGSTVTWILALLVFYITTVRVFSGFVKKVQAMGKKVSFGAIQEQLARFKDDQDTVLSKFTEALEAVQLELDKEKEDRGTAVTEAAAQLNEQIEKLRQQKSAAAEGAPAEEQLKAIVEESLALERDERSKALDGLREELLETAASPREGDMSSLLEDEQKDRSAEIRALKETIAKRLSQEREDRNSAIEEALEQERSRRAEEISATEDALVEAIEEEKQNRMNAMRKLADVQDGETVTSFRGKVDELLHNIKKRQTDSSQRAPAGRRTSSLDFDGTEFADDTADYEDAEFELPGDEPDDLDLSDEEVLFTEDDEIESPENAEKAETDAEDRSPEADVTGTSDAAQEKASASPKNRLSPAAKKTKKKRAKTAKKAKKKSGVAKKAKKTTTKKQKKTSRKRSKTKATAQAAESSG